MIKEPSLNKKQSTGICTGSILLRDYMRAIEPTDKLSQSGLRPILMGLFGEVGSIMAVSKKCRREQDAYPEYHRAIEEEFGDVLWYFTALCRYLKVGVDVVFSEAVDKYGYDENISASDLPGSPLARVLSVNELPTLDMALLNLGQATAVLLNIDSPDEQTSDLLRTFSNRYLQALQAAHLNFSKIIRMNIEKVRGRFLDPGPSTLPVFDKDFTNEERLPWQFEIKITQRKSGCGYLQWNGVFIGEPLTDNILSPDGYRFHDVFHFAHAAILHWSPVFRALIKQKRKSRPQIDEAEDGGRAIVVEEGLTAWIFSRAKQLNFFEEHNSVSFDLLKTIQQFVQGYEVEACPLKLWEQAILNGYSVFRQVQSNNGGIVVGDRKDRTLTYKPIEG